MILRLLNWKLLLFRRSGLQSTRAKIGKALIAACALALFVALLSGFRRLFSSLGNLPGLTGQVEIRVFEAGVLSSVYLAALAISFFVGFRSAFAGMYSSSDLPLLFAAPVKVSTVFTLKFIEVVASVFLSVALLVLPVTLGYGAAVKAGALYYLLVLLLLFLISFMSAALGVLVNLLVMRIIPPYRIKELGILLGSVLGAALYALSQFGTHFVLNTGPQQVAELLGRFSLAQVSYSPAWWLGQATVAAAGNEGFLPWFALLAVFSLSLFLLSFSLVQEAFYGGWAGSGEAWRKKKRKQAGEPRLIRRLGYAAISDSPTAAMALKELRTIFRDLREWSQAAYGILVMLVAFIAPMLRGSGFAAMDNFRGSSLYLLLGFSYLLTGMLALNLALGAVSREGRCWFFLSGFPLTVRQIIWGKFFALLPVVFVPAALLILGLGFFFGAAASSLWPVWGFIFLFTPAAVAFNIAVGSYNPNFTAEEVNKRIPFEASLLSMFIGLLYTIPMIAGIALVALGSWTGLGLALRLAGFAVLLGANAATVVVSLRLAVREMENSDHWPG